ncbi:MAG TPA: type II toxin-antitoxin system HipA family toxin [Burkholderiaceae bacterium]|nr:type II toxin-antitoxin system HipA family toxin [Burkholderiaceae bacterium]
MRALWVWMNGVRVGTWRVGPTGLHRFEYAPSWLHSPRARPLSLSLPLSAGALQGPVVAHFFDNLLPDSEAIRQRIRTRRRLPGADVFSLLQAIGRDCVGAVQLLPPDAPPQGFDTLAFEPLSHADIEGMLTQLGPTATPAAPGTADDRDIRLSIAGAQEKTALLRVNGQWARPLGATPTTHILKPAIGIVPGTGLDMRQSVENEWLCRQIVDAVGLPAAPCTMETFGSQRVLVVERFDRAWQPGGWIARLPQEDLCQATGVASHTKYESDGGPGLARCLGILRASENYERDGLRFLLAQLLFWFLAAIDGHAKNFSVFLLPGGGYRLTPLYDVLSAWPVIGRKGHEIPYPNAKLAMALRAKSAHYHLATLQRRHWEQLAQDSGIPHAWREMQALADRLPGAMDAVLSTLPADFPTALAERMGAGVQKHLNRFKVQG